MKNRLPAVQKENKKEISMSEKFRNLKKYKTINGMKMAHIKEGEGDSIVFLHGNPNVVLFVARGDARVKRQRQASK